MLFRGGKRGNVILNILVSVIFYGRFPSSSRMISLLCGTHLINHALENSVLLHLLQTNTWDSAKIFNPLILIFEIEFSRLSDLLLH